MPSIIHVLLQNARSTRHRQRLPAGYSVHVVAAPMSTSSMLPCPCQSPTESAPACCLIYTHAGWPLESIVCRAPFDCDGPLLGNCMYSTKQQQGNSCTAWLPSFSPWGLFLSLATCSSSSFCATLCLGLSSPPHTVPIPHPQRPLCSLAPHPKGPRPPQFCMVEALWAQAQKTVGRFQRPVLVLLPCQGPAASVIRV